MITKNIESALNKQTQAEFYSSYLYLAMAAYCQEINLKGFAHWLRVQAKEENAHAMKIYDHILERGGKIKLQALEAPPASFKSPLDLFKKVLEHEKKVTKLIYQLYETAIKEGDHAASVMLQWFVSEQVEEEANATEIVEKLKAIPEESPTIFFLDEALGKRE